MEIRSIEFGSPEYEQSLALRNHVLRCPLGLDVYAEDLALERDQWHFVLEDNGTIVGCVLAVPKSKGHAKLRQMAIAAERQRQGLGRQLLTNVELHLALRGIRTVELAARQQAIEFYLRLDYQRVGEEFIEVGIPHCQMVKTLARRPHQP